MRRLLLFTFIFSFIAIASCTRDQESTKVSQEEKEYLVKQTIIEFNNSAIKTGKYKEFIGSISQKSAKEPLNSAELETMIQEFLGDQTQAFLDVYYQLVALNMTAEELENIAYTLEYLIVITNDSDKDVGCCEASSNIKNEVASMLFRLVCCKAA